MKRRGEAATAGRRKVRPARPTVGWREWAGLPDLKVAAIKVKVDTGARTSALHAFNIRPFRKAGADWVRFDIHPLQRNDRRVLACACPTHDHRWVTNSGGGREKRFVIMTPIRLGDHEWPIEITLADRDQMGFRMLLGRSALKGRFVVDPGRSFCRGKRKVGRWAGSSRAKPKAKE